MKFFFDLLVYVRRNYTSRRNVIQLQRFFMVLVVFVISSNLLFHLFMAREGREFSLITGLYWTLTVMSTLGLGDITFTSDAGRVFTMGVLISGVVFLLASSPIGVYGRPVRRPRPSGAV